MKEYDEEVWSDEKIVLQKSPSDGRLVYLMHNV